MLPTARYLFLSIYSVWLVLCQKTDSIDLLHDIKIPVENQQ